MSARDIFSVIDPDNYISRYFLKLDAIVTLTYLPLKLHRWGGSFKMYRFCRQFMTFPGRLKCWPPKIPPEVGATFLGSNHSQISPHARAKFGRDPTVELLQSEHCKFRKTRRSSKSSSALLRTWHPSCQSVVSLRRPARTPQAWHRVCLVAPSSRIVRSPPSNR